MLIPSTDQDFKIIGIEESRMRSTNVLDKIYDETCGTYLWYPVTKSNDLKELLDGNDKSRPLNKTIKQLLPNWEIEDDGKMIQKCWMMDYKRKYISDRDCLGINSCFSCLWPEKRILRLRGLCRKAKIEDHYTFVTRFNFKGVVGKQIQSMYLWRI